MIQFNLKIFLSLAFLGASFQVSADEKKQYSVGANLKSTEGGVIACSIASGGLKNLIATVKDKDGGSGIEWSSKDLALQFESTYLPGAMSTINGAANTAAIIAVNKNIHTAAKICYNLIENGKSDWYLPSKKELACLKDNVISIGGFAPTYYWSSTDISGNQAWAVSFGQGIYMIESKSNKHKVRCVRAFKPNSVSESQQKTVPAVGAHLTHSEGGVVACTQASGGIKNLIATTADKKVGLDVKWSENISSFIPNKGAISSINGAANTAAIVAENNANETAASVCYNLDENGKNDWYLPSRKELECLSDNQTEIGGFSPTNYWSSNEAFEGAAWVINFERNIRLPQSKNEGDNVRIRCVRTFMTTTSSESQPESTIAVGTDLTTAEGGIVACTRASGGVKNLIATTSDKDGGLGVKWGGNYFDSEFNQEALSSIDGAANTAAIVAENSTGNFAATICNNLDENGKNDWYLPSKQELECLSDNQTEIGGFSPTNYWSSTELGKHSAWGVMFEKGEAFIFDQHYELRVRCVRSFTP